MRSLSPGYIRLLELRPGNPNDVLEFELRVEKLVNSPVYEALSYVWGNAPAEEEAQGYRITPQLAVALRYLRKEDSSRILWIDQLCIRQSDVVERNTQVGMMGEIYTKATSVCIWLGEAELLSPHLWKLASHLTMEEG